MELGEYLTALRKGWLVIALLAVVGGTAGYAQAVAATPTYRSSSTVYVSLTRGDTVSELVQGSTYTQNLVETYVQLVRMPVVLDPVIEELGLSGSSRGLAGSITADSPLNTLLIEVSAVSKSPQRAAEIANATAASLARAVDSVSPKAADGQSSVKMTVVETAMPTTTPFSPKPRRDAAAGGAVGVLLGVVLALLRAQLDTRIRTVTDLPIAPARVRLGQIPLDRSLTKHPRVLISDPHGPLAESYRRIRTNLQFLDSSKPLRSIVISSSVPGEGKSTTSVNIALTMAEKRKRVLLVDTDLRSPSIARICGIEGAAGLSAVLSHQADIEDIVQPWGAPGLHVITAGQIPPNPSQLIDSDAMDAFLHEAGQAYDLVILDTAPLLAVTDAAILARKTDGAVIVARSRKVRRPVLAEALASLDGVDATCLGILVNGVPTSRSDLRYGYGHARYKRSGRLRRLRKTRARDRSGAPLAPVVLGRTQETDALAATETMERGTAATEVDASTDTLDLSSELAAVATFDDAEPDPTAGTTTSTDDAAPEVDEASPSHFAHGVDQDNLGRRTHIADESAHSTPAHLVEAESYLARAGGPAQDAE